MSSRLRRAAAVAAALLVTGLAVPAQARPAEEGRITAPCIEAGRGAAKDRAGQLDHRELSAAEAKRVDARTSAILASRARRGVASRFAGPVVVPVWVHVMIKKNGDGDVTNEQIRQQIQVLNDNFAGRESPDASNTGFSFQLQGITRTYNNAYHKDKESETYRAATRKGFGNTLNMWLVDFAYLGIATFPFDYTSAPSIDGVRVHYASLPGGAIADYNLG